MSLDARLGGLFLGFDANFSFLFRFVNLLLRFCLYNFVKRLCGLIIAQNRPYTRYPIIDFPSIVSTFIHRQILSYPPFLSVLLRFKAPTFPENMEITL